MMKRTVPFLSLLLFVSPLAASTPVPSTLLGDVEWTRAGSPYLLQGKVTVPAGATLRIRAGVQVQFQGASVLEVNGNLEAVGSAAGPVEFNMTQGGLRSELYVNGGRARIVNAKVLSGIFLARDAELTLEGTEVTRGSGVYLQGTTNATLKSNKIYGNAAGVAFDGPVRASVQFNTLVHNTYGLYVRNLAGLEFKNNSIHDNQKEVVNGSGPLNLGGNHWGTEDLNVAKGRVQGPAEIAPLKSLKDVLRAYIRTQMPPITQKMSADLAAKQRAQEKERALALKKHQAAKDIVAEKPGTEAAEPSTASVEPAKEPEAEAVPYEPPPAGSKTAAVKPLTPSPRTLKPLKNLPPDQGDVASVASAPLPAGEKVLGTALAPPPPTAPSGSDAALAPPPLADPGADDLPAPDFADTGSDDGMAFSEPGEVPPPPDMTSVDAAPPVPNVPAASAIADVEAPPVPSEVMEPPTLNETRSATVVDQDVSGDIDGMRAPPLDLFGGLADVPLEESYKNRKKSDNASNVEMLLPPLEDIPVEPPKDLDLPPMDDLGDIDLDSKL